MCVCVWGCEFFCLFFFCLVKKKLTTKSWTVKGVYIVCDLLSQQVVDCSVCFCLNFSMSKNPPYPHPPEEGWGQNIWGILTHIDSFLRVCVCVSLSLSLYLYIYICCCFPSLCVSLAVHNGFNAVHHYRSQTSLASHLFCQPFLRDTRNVWGYW